MEPVKKVRERMLAREQAERRQQREQALELRRTIAESLTPIEMELQARKEQIELLARARKYRPLPVQIHRSPVYVPGAYGRWLNRRSTAEERRELAREAERLRFQRQLLPPADVIASYRRQPC